MILFIYYRRHRHLYTLRWQELVLVIWFGTEFIVRIWSAGYRSRYRQIAGRLRFLRRPLCIVGMSTVHSRLIYGAIMHYSRLHVANAKKLLVPVIDDY